MFLFVAAHAGALAFVYIKRSAAVQFPLSAVRD